MRIGLAFRVFFKALFDSEFASRVGTLQDDAPTTTDTGPTPQEPAEKVTKRSDAITLLATLQREARLVDMVKEPLASYSDAQIGAAARDVLRDCGKVLERLFDLAPLSEREEGSDVEVPAGYDAGRIRLAGKVSGQPPFRGRIVHHGWIATHCEVPEWTGSEQSQLVVAPEEVEVV